MTWSFGLFCPQLSYAKLIPVIQLPKGGKDMLIKELSSPGASTEKIKRIPIEAQLKGTGLYDDPEFMQEISPFFNPLKPAPEFSVVACQELAALIIRRKFTYLSPEAAAIEVGRATFRGFYKKMVVGGIALAALKMMNPPRFTTVGARLFAEYGLGVVRHESQGEKQLRVSYRGFPYPAHVAVGIWLEAADSAGTPHPSYQIERLLLATPPRYNFDILYAWE
jgi:hypothetical protein